MNDILQFALAGAEGFALAFSPCILPILPLILSGAAGAGRARPFAIILGFIIFFTILALISRTLLSWLGIPQDVLQTASFAMLALFGVFMLFPQMDNIFSKITGGFAGRAQQLSGHAALNNGFAGGLIMGGLIGIVWTPCAGPLMAAALLQIIQAQTNTLAVLTILSFAVGAGVPMLIIALLGHKITHHVRGFAKHTSTIKRAMGVVLILFSLIGFSGINLGEVYVRAQSSISMVKPISFEKGLINGLQTPYLAPEIAGIDIWLNTKPDQGPTNIAALKGKVVLVDFWTYSCINCVRTLPHLKSWYETYHKDGFEIIGVHAPEFDFEKNKDNVQKAINKFGITYPVALDNNFTTWKNYNNKYWPAHYLIDRDGRVVYTHFGEGKYEETEHNIQYLLGLSDATIKSKSVPVIAKAQTPETYLGTDRAEREAGMAEKLPLHHWALSGAWVRSPHYIESQSAGDSLTVRAQAKKIFLVLDTKNNTIITATINIKTKKGNETKTIMVKSAELYELVNLTGNADALVSITAHAAGLRAFAFTFESGA